MNTDSYISLYTYLFGWHFYGQLFTLLQVTGLWALPFVYPLAEHLRPGVPGELSLAV